MSDERPNVTPPEAFLRRRPAAAEAAAPPARDGAAFAFPPRPPAGEVLPFRRRAVKTRRRRRGLAVRLLRPAAVALAVVGAPLAAAAWMLTTPRFALAETAVAGTERVTAEWVEARLALFAGANLLTLPLAEVEAALGGHPWIAGVSLRKDLPRKLAVEIVERRPAALVPGPGGPWLADREGGRIVPAPPGADERFLLVVPPPGRRGVEVAAALDVAAEVARLEPVWAAGLVRVDALGEGDFRLHSTALPAPLTVRAGRLAAGAEWVERALPAVSARFDGEVGAIDARLAGRLIVRRAGGEGTGGGTTITGATG
jgi:hypothetical protein